MTDQGPVVVVIGESFETFYAREYRALVALTYVLSGSRSVAEDLAQDAMASTYRQWSRVSAMDSRPATSGARQQTWPHRRSAAGWPRPRRCSGCRPSRLSCRRWMRHATSCW